MIVIILHSSLFPTIENHLFEKEITMIALIESLPIKRKISGTSVFTFLQTASKQHMQSEGYFRTCLRNYFYEIK